MCFDRRKDLLTQVVLFKQMTEGQDRCLIRDLVADQVNACKPTHSGHHDQGLFHGRIAEGVPLLQHVDPQHRGQCVRRLTTFSARLWLAFLDPLDQSLPWLHHHHLRDKRLLFGLLLGCGELVIREAKLLAACKLNLGMESQDHCPANWPGFQSLLSILVS